MITLCRILACLCAAMLLAVIAWPRVAFLGALVFFLLAACCVAGLVWMMGE